MATKSNQRGIQVPPGHEQYVTRNGERMKFLTYTGNVPRISGARTGKDAAFLSSNDGKLSKLQQNF